MTQADPNVELKPWSELDADGLDRVEALVTDATAVVGICNVHEGGGYYAERIIKRAIEQGSLCLPRVEPTLHPLPSEATEKLNALRRMCESTSQSFYVEIIDEVLAMQRSTPTAPVPSDATKRMAKILGADFVLNDPPATAPVQGDDAEITDVNRAGRELDRRDTQVELLRLRTFVLKLAGFSFPQAGEGSDGKRFAKALREIRRDARNLLDTLGDAK